MLDQFARFIIDEHAGVTDDDETAAVLGPEPGIMKVGVDSGGEGEVDVRVVLDARLKPAVAEKRHVTALRR